MILNLCPKCGGSIRLAEAERLQNGLAQHAVCSADMRVYPPTQRGAFGLGCVAPVLIAKMELGEYPAAFGDLRTALEEEPENYIAWANLAELFFRLGMQTEAHEAFASAQSFAPDISSGSQASFFLAVQAAELGLLAEVVKYSDLARSLLGAKVFDLLAQEPRRWVLRHALLRAELLGDKLTELGAAMASAAAQPDGSDDEYDRARQDVYDHMAPLWQEALASELS